jgi:C-terminal processing protease CtpA/Prc
MDVLGDCLLYIDIPGKRLLIKKPPRVNVGGMGVAWTQLARVVVIYVEEGSSAQAAGVKVDDEVMEINDKLSRDLTPEKLTAELKAVGKGDMTVKILPSGKAEPRTVILKL